MPRSFDVEGYMDRNTLAVSIANKYTTWKDARIAWEKDKEELQRYLFATDTRSTTNANSSWRNSTVTPKLTQIRDNLHANYMAALFPNDDWLVWEATDEDSATEEKRKKVTAFMRQKVNQKDFEKVTSQLLYDYIDNGVSIAGSYFEREVKYDDEGNEVYSHSKPVAYRVDPIEHVFDITSTTYNKAPKITRSIVSIGDLLDDANTAMSKNYDQSVVQMILDKRAGFRSLTDKQQGQFNQIRLDGFGSWTEYYSSEYVELLEFEGSIYDPTTQEYHKDVIITVVDRSYILRMEPNPSWTGQSNKKLVGWRMRPNNLMAQGPLDNLVGMQYRIDHLENLRADAFDMIAFPMIKIQGYGVEDFDYVPGERIFTGEDGDVSFLHPDTTVLNADMQIQMYENKMEEFAGAPRNQMGIRTPGEKTKFEVQMLDNAAKGIFQVKIEQFETQLLEPLVNDMFALAVQNMGPKEVIELTDEVTGAKIYETITKEDVTLNGSFKPKGASYFLNYSNKLQDLIAFASSPLGQDTGVKVHMSGLKLAKVAEQLLGLEDLGIVQENVSVYEQGQTQEAVTQVQNVLAENAAISPTEGGDIPPELAEEGAVNSAV